MVSVDGIERSRIGGWCSDIDGGVAVLRTRKRSALSPHFSSPHLIPSHPISLHCTPPHAARSPIQTEAVYAGPTAVAPPAGAVGGGWIAETDDSGGGGGGGGSGGGGGGRGGDGERESEVGADYAALSLALTEETVPGATAL